MFDVISIPAFKDNYIWLLRKGKAAVVVDPGDAHPVLDVLAREGLTLTAILITHHHADHQGGVAGLLAQTPDKIDVFGPATESITGLTRPLAGGERIDLPALGISFDVLAIPGHTAGHIAYLGEGCVFCGDTLFAGGCGRVFEGTFAQMADSLDKLARLPAETQVYCAHEYTEANLRFAMVVEPGSAALRERVEDVRIRRTRGEATVPSSIGLERMTNPFLRCAEPEVVASAQARTPGASDPVAVFSVLREWKNAF